MTRRVIVFKYLLYIELYTNQADYDEISSFTGCYMFYIPVKVFYTLINTIMTYFDNNSTTQMLPEVKKALKSAIDSDLGNPEALGRINRHAKDVIEESRLHVANLLGSSSEKLLFTSSGSESNTIGILSSVLDNKKKKIVCSGIEHASISNLLEMFSVQGHSIEVIRTLPSGVIDTEHAVALIDDHTALVTVQLVNNETGVIQPIEQIQRLAHAHGAKFHCDGAQAVGKMPVQVESLGCDYFSFTAHKFHGPKGVGALWVGGPIDEVYPLVPGGNQEYGKRGGTHNVLGILGMGVAAKHKQETLDETLQYTKHLRDLFETTLAAQNNMIKINGIESPRVGNTSNVQFVDIDGKALFLNLLNEDIICSQTSACTAQNPEPSKTLVAMGLSFDEAFNSIRFSFSEQNSEEEIFYAAKRITARYRHIQHIFKGGL